MGQEKECYTHATLKPVDRAILDDAVKLTRASGQITRADVKGLREASLNDRAILDVAQVTAYTLNRLAQGPGG